MNNDYLVKIKDLKKKFKNHIVFDHLNLSIANNQITTIYGESGSGKSTLLNIIGLLERFDGGSITLFHEESPKVGSKKAREFLQNHISYLFQNFALINDQSIKKNLDLANLNPKESKKQFNKRKNEILHRLNIVIDEKTKVGVLSGGQQQRIALARAILKPGELLLCDEPTGSLDPTNKEIIFRALEQLKEQVKTILIVSHDPYIIENSDIIYDIESLSK